MKKNLKSIVAILVVVLLAAVSIVGCQSAPAASEKPGESVSQPSQATQPAQQPAEKKITIGFIAMNMYMTWMQYALEGAKKTAEANGVELIIYDAENKVDKQASLMEDLIAKKVDAIMTDPINIESLTPMIQEADKAGIPVCTFDRRAEGAPYFAFVGSDDVLGGKMAAKFIADKLGGKGKVIELVGQLGASPTIDRGNGFHEEMKNYPGIEIAFSQSGAFEREKGMSVMEDAMQSVGDFDAVFSHNDDMMMGALQAMKDAGKDLSKIVTISYDGVPDALKAIQDGLHDATIQYPVGQAGKAMQIIIDYLKTKKMPEKKDDKIDPWIITKDNLDSGDFYPELSK